MPRKARIIVPGAFHHVMARAIDGKALFREDDDRKKFISILKEGLDQGKHRLYAWALLSNHYHLLVRVSDSSFSDMMRRVNSRYARHYSGKYKRRGYLFQDRYKSIVTQDQKYVEEIIRYIHGNPMRAGLCRGLRDLEKYPWCGHGILMGARTEGLLEPAGEILKRFGKTTKSAREAYRRFMEEGLSHKDEKGGIVAAIRKSNEGREDRLSPGSWVIGDDEFVKKVIEQDRQKRIRLARYMAEKITLNDIARKVAFETGIAVQDLRCRGQGGVISEARKVFSYVSRRIYEFPVREIGSFLGISGPPVSISVPAGEKLVKSGKVKINL